MDRVITYVEADQRKNVFQELKDECSSVVKHNLESVNYLNIKEFRAFAKRFREYSGLVFYKYFPLFSDKDSPIKWTYAQEDKLLLDNPQYYNDIFEGYVKSLDGHTGFDIQHIIKKACNAVETSCFSEDWDNLLMHAHYASDYKGFCVGFDLSSFIDSRMHYPYFSSCTLL